MRKILRNMAKVKMKEMGYSKINKRMRHGYWREIIDAYPINLVTGKKMAKNFRGLKRNRPGSYFNLFTYQ